MIADQMPKQIIKTKNQILSQQLNLQDKPLKTIYEDWQEFMLLPEDKPEPRSKIRRDSSMYLETFVNKQATYQPDILINETEVKPRKMELPLSYCRARRKLIDEEPIYEPTETDIKFVQTYHKEFIDEGKSVLTFELLVDVNVYMYGMERANPKEYPIQRWLTEFFETWYPEIRTLYFYVKLRRLVFQYWLARRCQYSFPVYRGNWDLGTHDNNKKLRCFPKQYAKKKKLDPKVVEQVAEQMNKQFCQLTKLCDQMIQAEQKNLMQKSQIIQEVADSVVQLGNQQLENEVNNNVTEKVYKDFFTTKRKMKNQQSISNYFRQKQKNKPCYFARQKKEQQDRKIMNYDIFKMMENSIWQSILHENSIRPKFRNKLYKKCRINPVIIDLQE